MSAFLALPREVALKVLHDPAKPWYDPMNWFQGTGSLPDAFGRTDASRLKDEVEEWCLENMKHPVAPLWSWGQNCHGLSFGSDDDAVIFKTVWW